MSAKQACRLVIHADSMTKKGIDLSRQAIGSAVKDGVHKDFIRIIEKAREINDRNGFGKHGTLLSLINSEIGNWSDLMNKCIMILPVLKAIKNDLTYHVSR